jgi:hypothetical protein
MSEQPTRTVPPSIEDFDSIISFITARLEPLRRSSYDSEMEPALAAEVEMRDRQSAAFEFHQLHLIARRWRDHPDYQKKWRA